jgi:hypothetical protein
VLRQIPMVAETSVPKLTFGQMLLRVFKTAAMARG